MTSLEQAQKSVDNEDAKRAYETIIAYKSSLIKNAIRKFCIENIQSGESLIDTIATIKGVIQ